MRTSQIWAAAIVLAAVGGAACGKGDGPAPRPAPTAVVEGAMCAEHGVLEAICTKCNPKLIPVFQAKGDWCPDHGFPESVCPICHPERGGKPAGDVGGDAAPADGTRVRLARADTARIAGIATVRAEARPGGTRLEVLATITYDARKHAAINARAAGVVRALHVDVGDAVTAGAALAVIESAAVGGDRSRLAAATSRVGIAEENYQRAQDLHASGVAPRTDVLAARQELAAATAERGAVSAALGAIGGGTARGGYVLRSPIAGTVTTRGVSIGHMVDLDAVLFDVVDVSTMRAELEIPETALGVVRVGHAVTIAIDGLDTPELAGTIDYLAPEISRETRTVKARVTLANPDGVLRANMLARARIALGAVRPSVTVPPAAVQRVGDLQLVFVELGAGDYEVRRVTIGVAERDRVEVIAGLTAGEVVVTQGSFLLKTETLKGSIGAGCCE